MKNSAVCAHLGLNILVTGGLGYLIIKQNDNSSGASSSQGAASEAPALVVDLKPLEKPLAEVIGIGVALRGDRALISE